MVSSLKLPYVLIDTAHCPGLSLSALVIQYADNLLKCFATSLSILMSLLASVVIFDFSVGLPISFGACTASLTFTLFLLVDSRYHNRSHSSHSCNVCVHITGWFPICRILSSPGDDLESTKIIPTLSFFTMLPRIR